MKRVKVVQKMTAGQVAAATYRLVGYERFMSQQAHSVADVIRRSMGEDTGQLIDNVRVDEGTEEVPTAVVVDGDHPNTNGRPQLDYLGVPFMHNFGKGSVNFMEAGALEAERNGAHRSRS